MARPQNSPRGLFAKEKIYITSAGNTSAQLTADTSGNLKLNVGLLLSGQTSGALTANSTASLIFPVESSIPTSRVVGGVCFVSNSTGKMLAYHSTGTTWLYANSTSILA